MIFLAFRLPPSAFPAKPEFLAKPDSGKARETSGRHTWGSSSEVWPRHLLGAKTKGCFEVLDPHSLGTSSSGKSCSQCSLWLHQEMWSPDWPVPTLASGLIVPARRPDWQGRRLSALRVPSPARAPDRFVQGPCFPLLAAFGFPWFSVPHCRFGFPPRHSNCQLSHPSHERWV